MAGALCHGKPWTLPMIRRNDIVLETSAAWRLPDLKFLSGKPDQSSGTGSTTKIQGDGIKVRHMSGPCGEPAQTSTRGIFSDLSPPLMALIPVI